MSLARRVPRPLTREVGEPRDTRLFVVACDDTFAPDQYFSFFRIPRVKVHVVPTIDGTSTAKQVLARLREIETDEEDERWMLLDTDHCITGAHVKGFQAAIRDAESHGIQVALSRPCFEFWLLLHHLGLPPDAEYRECGSVEMALRIILGGYNKTRLRRQDFLLESVLKACTLAREIDAQVKGGRIPKSNTSRVFQLWESIARGSAFAQLPPELQQLKRRLQSEISGTQPRNFGGVSGT